MRQLEDDQRDEDLKQKEKSTMRAQHCCSSGRRERGGKGGREGRSCGRV
jgi:hypothetical protein